MLAASTLKKKKEQTLSNAVLFILMFRVKFKFPFSSPLLRLAEYNICGTAGEDTELHTSKLTEQSHFLWFRFWPCRREDVERAYTAPQFEIQYSPPACCSEKRIFCAPVKLQNKLILHIHVGEGFTWAWNKYSADLFPGLKRCYYWAYSWAPTQGYGSVRPGHPCRSTNIGNGLWIPLD